MSDIIKATTFMLLSTFSLSLSGLVAKYLSEAMPISLLSFVRFFLPSLLIFLFLIFSKISRPTGSMWKPLGRVDLCCTFRDQQYIGSHINMNASDNILA